MARWPACRYQTSPTSQRERSRSKNRQSEPEHRRILSSIQEAPWLPASFSSSMTTVVQTRPLTGQTSSLSWEEEAMAQSVPMTCSGSDSIDQCPQPSWPRCPRIITCRIRSNVVAWPICPVLFSSRISAAHARVLTRRWWMAPCVTPSAPKGKGSRTGLVLLLRQLWIRLPPWLLLSPSHDVRWRQRGQTACLQVANAQQ